MRKYVAIFRTAFQNSITWRGAFWFYVGLNFLPFVTYYFLWTSIFHDRAEAAGFSYATLLTYTVVALIFARFTWVSPEYGVMENIREGTLAKYLVQPIPYFGYYWSSRLAFRAFAFLITLPFSLLVIWLLRSILVLPNDAWRWIAIGVDIPIAFGLQFYLGIILGLLSFWILEARYFQFFKDAALALLSGALLPYAFFGASLSHILRLLPFRYLAGFPVEVYLGRTTLSETLIGLLVGAGWVLLLHLIARTMWNRGLKRFVAVGN